MSLTQESRAFTLIELLVSMFIMMVLLGVGFYSFNKYENYSNFDKGLTEVKTALDTAHDYSMALPRSIKSSDLSKVTDTGVEFDTFSGQYRYRIFYLAEGIRYDLSELGFLPEGFEIKHFTSGATIYPTVTFSVPSGKVSGWCEGLSCLPATLSDDKDVKLKFTKGSATFEEDLTISNITGLIQIQ
jgi:type II secretory pathway pseudopilin PulG